MKTLIVTVQLQWKFELCATEGNILHVYFITYIERHTMPGIYTSYYTLQWQCIALLHNTQIMIARLTDFDTTNKRHCVMKGEVVPHYLWEYSIRTCLHVYPQLTQNMLLKDFSLLYITLSFYTHAGTKREVGCNRSCR